jgi:hypothetical protein
VTADVLSHAGGSFDDLPDVELRTVLAVPVSLPQVSEPVHPSRPAGQGPRTHARSRTSAHRGRHRALPQPSTGPIATVQVGLSAAATVFVAVALLLLVTEVLLG